MNPLLLVPMSWSWWRLEDRWAMGSTVGWEGYLKLYMNSKVIHCIHPGYISSLKVGLEQNYKQDLGLHRKKYPWNFCMPEISPMHSIFITKWKQGATKGGNNFGFGNICHKNPLNHQGTIINEQRILPLELVRSHSTNFVPSRALP